MATDLVLRTTLDSGLGATGKFFLDLPVNSFGAGLVTFTVDTAASGTQIQWTRETAIDSEVEWVSGRVPSGGFTLTSLTSVDMWMSESMTTANCGGRIRLFKLSPSGVETELAGGPFDDGVEIGGTSLTNMTWTANPTDTAFAENDRLLLKVYITNIGTMAGSLTCGLGVNAASGATGDSKIVLNETVAFKAERNSSGEVLLLHLDGTDTSTTFTDSSVLGGHTFTAGGGAQLDTAKAKFGSSSLLLNGTDAFIKLATHSQDFAFLRGDFTLDFWLWRFTAGASHVLFDCRPVSFTGGDSGPGAVPIAFLQLSLLADNTLQLFVDQSGRINGTTALTTGQWYHVALTRSGNDHRLFLDGVQEGYTYTADWDYHCAFGRPYFGASSFIEAGQAFTDGWMDEIRVLRGQAAWTANFTPPTAAYSVASKPFMRPIPRFYSRSF